MHRLLKVNTLINVMCDLQKARDGHYRMSDPQLV